jgi:hypothetical protein
MEQSESKIVSEIAKEFKSSGQFDEFRKNCYTDIISQPSFQILKKNVQTFVHQTLEDKKWNINMKKNVVKENLRRKLNE